MENTNTQIQTVEPTTEISAEAAGKQLKQMMEFANRWLKEEKDYGKIGNSTKPSLFKSGAEKMNILMGLRPNYDLISETTIKEDTYYKVVVKCALKDRFDNVIADCIGSCNNKESARKNVPFYDSMNPVLKTAEKRAYVGATLHANALSQIYTQDLEDDFETKTETNGKQLLQCSKCRKEVTTRIADFSANKHGRILCLDCQKSE